MESSENYQVYSVSLGDYIRVYNRAGHRTTGNRRIQHGFKEFYITGFTNSRVVCNNGAFGYCQVGIKSLNKTWEIVG